MNVAEAITTAQSQMSATLDTGLNTLSGDQTVTFTPYIRLVLPLDGYVFWVRAELLSDSAIYNASQINVASLNQPPTLLNARQQLVAMGSLHIANANQQDADESFSLNRVVFTSEVPVNDLNAVSPTLMYIAVVNGLRFAFSQRKSFYRQAGLYHYVGDAVYPVMATQIIDSLQGLDTTNVIASNSLPIWLGLNKYMPMFPSFLVPENITPPYCSVHIAPESTRALQAAPYTDLNSNHWQLVSERVKLTIYGLRNFNALAFQDYVFQASLDTDTFGIMNSPVMCDEKRTQAELNVIAQKKTFDMEVSYYQQAVYNVARQLIITAIESFIIAK